MGKYQFPFNKIVCEEKPFSSGLLSNLLEKVYAASPSFIGYLMISERDSSRNILLFFNGAPFAVGRYCDGKSVRCSLRDFADHVASAADTMVSIFLCETDPVLLKCMQLFLGKDPEIKAPASFINIEQVVQQMSDAGDNALIALCREDAINYFYFRDGKGALSYYSDQMFARPDNMGVDEQMMLYAFQPGAEIHASVFRDVPGSGDEPLGYVDRESLYRMLTVGAPRNRRKEDRSRTKSSVAVAEGKQKVDSITAPQLIKSALDADDVARQPEKVSSVSLYFESGPLKGQNVTVELPCVIGRKECDLVLDDPHVSRRHARLKMVEHILIIEDLGSKNGTRSNGETITIKWLKANDLISVGTSNFKVSAE